MDESIYRNALAAISSGDYGENDVKDLKLWLEDLNRKELELKREMEKTKNNFVKNKDKNGSKLKAVRSDIKMIKGILKTIK